MDVVDGLGTHWQDSHFVNGNMSRTRQTEPQVHMVLQVRESVLVIPIL